MSLQINNHETTLRALSNDYWLLLYMHDTYIHSININFTYITKIHKMLSTKFAHIPPIPIRNDGQIINTIYDLSKEY